MEIGAIHENSFLIAARSTNDVIGRDGAIPWHAPHDLKRFKMLTMGTAMIMGRNTWDSLPGPLRGRISIVVTSRPLENRDAIAAPNFEAAIQLAVASRPIANAIAFIGGARIYQQALELDWLTKAHVTTVDVVTEGDTFFQMLTTPWKVETVYKDKTAPACEFTYLTRERNAA
ncbi:dihydrofolate reductase [Erythrobacter aureus]|uniref:dihydrofolate reductase n=1 Tax=Erythrobacter aureus TaxID=2182384 RepID=A0A345YIG6_9SPHN|nr:dihydrofolate reductase [Erythrobacter aureus]AXK43718.1 dihydrofolate reductase [Erythrobacter aureus]